MPSTLFTVGADFAPLADAEFRPRPRPRPRPLPRGLGVTGSTTAISMGLSSVALSGSNVELDVCPVSIGGIRETCVLGASTGEGEVLRSKREGVSGFSTIRGEIRISLESEKPGSMEGSSEELVLPLASTISSGSICSDGGPSEPFRNSSNSLRTMFTFFGRPRGRFAGVGTSSGSSFPSSKPESLSAAFCIVSFVTGVCVPAPLRVLIRPLGGRIIGIPDAAVVSKGTGIIGADVIVAVVIVEGVLKPLLLLLLEVPFFSASVNGSSMIMQSELEPSSFSSSNTLVMFEPTIAGGSTTTGAIGGGTTVGFLRNSTDAGIACRAAARRGRDSVSFWGNTTVGIRWRLGFVSISFSLLLVSKAGRCTGGIGFGVPGRIEFILGI